MTPAYLAMGSNLGDRKAILDGAVASLAELPDVQVRAVSTYHETDPVGGPGGQGAFLNAAAAIETRLDPMTLLNSLRRIEQQAGRVRTIHWGERTLDLDLLLFDQQVIDTPELTVPHPRMGVRRFVLAPLAEIAPEVIDPVSGLTIRAMLAQLDRRPSYLAILAPPDRHRTTVFNWVREALNGEAIFPWGPPPETSRSRRRWWQSPWHDDWAGVPAHLLGALPRDRVDTGRWLVSDFWADRILLDLWYRNNTDTSRPISLFDIQKSTDPGSSIPLGLEDLLAIRDRLLSPTFVAVILPPTAATLPLRERLWDHCADDGSARFCRDWPGDTRAELDGLTRSFRERLPPQCALVPIAPGEPKSIAAEIVAACQASRPRSGMDRKPLSSGSDPFIIRS